MIHYHIFAAGSGNVEMFPSSHRGADSGTECHLKGTWPQWMAIRTGLFSVLDLSPDQTRCQKTEISLGW